MRNLKRIICAKLCRKDKILATRKQAVRKFKVLVTRKNKGHVKFSSREKWGGIKFSSREMMNSRPEPILVTRIGRKERGNSLRENVSGIEGVNSRHEKNSLYIEEKEILVTRKYKNI